MPKPPLQEGPAGHGKIRFINVREGVVAAECRFRDTDEEVRPVRAQGTDAASAEKNLIAKLNARTGPPPKKLRTLFGPHGEPLPEGLNVEGKILPTTTVREATMLWLTEVSNDKSRKQTRDYWRRVARQTVLKEPNDSIRDEQKRVAKEAQRIASLPVTLTKRDVRKFISTVSNETPGQGRKARQLLSLVLDEAVDDDVIKFNPARISKLPKSVAKARKASKKRLKALSVEQHYEFLNAYQT